MSERRYRFERPIRLGVIEQRTQSSQHGWRDHIVLYLLRPDPRLQAIR